MSACLCCTLIVWKWSVNRLYIKNYNRFNTIETRKRRERNNICEDLSPKIPNENVASVLASVTRVWAELEELEIEVGVKTQRSPDLGFCYMIFRWANGSSLNQVLKGSDMSVGDFVRSTKQLVDLLGQIANAAPELNKKCRQAVKLIDRGVVTYLLGDL
jgi:ATP-dependent RNA helicase HelY